MHEVPVQYRIIFIMFFQDEGFWEEYVKEIVGDAAQEELEYEYLELYRLEDLGDQDLIASDDYSLSFNWFLHLCMLGGYMYNFLSSLPFFSWHISKKNIPESLHISDFIFLQSSVSTGPMITW